MSSTTRITLPMGYIRTKPQYLLYRAAHIVNYLTGMSNPLEHETTALLQAIYPQNVFTDINKYVVNFEQPPNPESKDRADGLVRFLVEDDFVLRVLLFTECKRTSTHSASSLDILEEQAERYCRDYLEHYNKRAKRKGLPRLMHVYGCTAAGAHVRQWVRYDSGLWEPLTGTKTYGDWSQYLDLGDDEDAKQIKAAFDFMMAEPPFLAPKPESGVYSEGEEVEAGPSGQRMSYVMTDPAEEREPAYESPQDKGKGKELTAKQVSVTRVRHNLKKDEFVFEVDGKTRTTHKTDWEDWDYEGQAAWLYRGKRTNYITFKNVFK